MARMLVIADDFTGALDTGIQFAKKGICTQIILDHELMHDNLDSGVQVAVIDSETRHLPADEAGQKVYQLVLAARKKGIEMIYKKTDSALRGNIGSELTAQLAATGQNILVYIPAFPKMGRTTLNGVQYVNRVPVAESVFGCDPFEPVTSSFIPDIIARQSNVAVKVVTGKDREREVYIQDQPTIYVFDAEKDEDLKKIAGEMKQKNVNFLAGCAGFAEFLPELLQTEGKSTEEVKADCGMIVISGSINPITIRQIRRAREAGVPCYTLNQDQKIARYCAGVAEMSSFIEELKNVYRKERQIIIETADSRGYGESAPANCDFLRSGSLLLDPRERQMVADNVAEIVHAMVQGGMKGLYVFIGGDTMAAVMKRLGCRQIIPLKELMPGIVLSRACCRLGEIMAISKSGGFGEEDTLVNLLHEAEKERETYAAGWH